MSTDLFEGLPAKLQIGAFTFRLSVVEQASEKLAGNDGMANFAEFRIYLHPMLGQRVVEVALHEITHCVNWVYGVTDDSTEEQFATQHSKGMFDVYTRNPELLTWIDRMTRRLRKESKND